MTATTEARPTATETATEEYARLTELPASERTARQNARVRTLAKKLAPTPATEVETKEKSADAKTAKADAKAQEAADSDQLLVTHTREVEVAALTEHGWSKAALTREPELAGSTIMWRLGRLTPVDVLKVDALLKRIDAEGVEPPARKTADSTPARPTGPSRAVLIERVAAAESRLDAAASAKTVRELREVIAAALELLRGEVTVPQD